MANNFGSKRLVVGAHYGLRDWLSQRVTAVLMALFTLVLLVQLLFGRQAGLRPLGRHLLAAVDEAAAPSSSSSRWRWHAWVGMRDIWMDYVKPVGLRLALQVATHRLAGRLHRLGGAGAVEALTAHGIAFPGASSTSSSSAPAARACARRCSWRAPA